MHGREAQGLRHHKRSKFAAQGPRPDRRSSQQQPTAASHPPCHTPCSTEQALHGLANKMAVPVVMVGMPLAFIMLSRQASSQQCQAASTKCTLCTSEVPMGPIKGDSLHGIVGRASMAYLAVTMAGMTMGGKGSGEASLVSSAPVAHGQVGIMPVSSTF